MRSLKRIFTVFLLSLIANTGNAGKHVFSEGINSIKDAKLYCDSVPLDIVEGIWEFHDDETQVLIKRRSTSRIHYDLILLHTPDCRFVPGDTIGKMQKRIDKNRYVLSLAVDKTPELLSWSQKCVLEYEESNDSFIIEPMKLDISMRTMWFLPKFWRSIKVGFKNPVNSLHVGLVRVYPDNYTSFPIYF